MQGMIRAAMIADTVSAARPATRTDSNPPRGAAAARERERAPESDDLLAVTSPGATSYSPISVPGSHFDAVLDRTHWPPFGYERPRLKRTRLVWPNGVEGTVLPASDPERFRGPQFAAAWCDEIGKWPDAEAAWDMLQFGLRLGQRPRQLATTTPRPTKLLKRLLADPLTATTRMTTDENKAHLAGPFTSPRSPPAARQAGRPCGSGCSRRAPAAAAGR